jgi:hypothetical protein
MLYPKSQLFNAEMGGNEKATAPRCNIQHSSLNCYVPFSNLCLPVKVGPAPPFPCNNNNKIAQLIMSAHKQRQVSKVIGVTKIMT